MSQPVAWLTHRAAPYQVLSEIDLPALFQRVYFHLYSNSNASRAEALLSDLSLLLLAKLLSESESRQIELHAFLDGKQSANMALLPRIREAYPGLVDASARFRLHDDSLRHALRELGHVSLSSSASHVLGEAFQALIGPRIRGDKGQFFTPRSLVRVMVEIVAPEPGHTILDPACGTGGFLYESLSFVHAQGGEPALVVGIDKDRELSRLAAALLGFRSARCAVHHMNALSPVSWSQANLAAEFDVILTNPPFGARIQIRDEAILKEYDLAADWRMDEREGQWRPTRSALNSQDPQILFLELCIKRLREGGKMGIVLPEGVFGNKHGAYVWDFVRSQGEILALLDCPRTTFQPGTDTKTNVLFFRKGAARTKAKSRTVAIAVALHCGHDRRGRTQRSDGTPYPDDFPHLGESFRHSFSGDASCPWRQVVLSNPYYLIPRYYAHEPKASPADASMLAGAEWMALGELVDRGWIDIRKGHEVGSEAYGTGDVPFVRTSDIANFEVSADPTKLVSDEVYDEYGPQQRLKPGSILIVVDGRYRIGTTAILTQRTCRCVVQSHFRIIDVLDTTRLEPFALLFALNLPSVRRRIRNLVFIQSTLGTLGARLLELNVPILRSDGPWSAAVERFRHSLMRRDELLAELGAIVGPDVEL